MGTCTAGGVLSNKYSLSRQQWQCPESQSPVCCIWQSCRSVACLAIFVLQHHISASSTWCPTLFIAPIQTSRTPKEMLKSMCKCSLIVLSRTANNCKNQHQGWSKHPAIYVAELWAYACVVFWFYPIYSAYIRSKTKGAKGGWYQILQKSCHICYIAIQFLLRATEFCLCKCQPSTKNRALMVKPDIFWLCTPKHAPGFMLFIHT